MYKTRILVQFDNELLSKLLNKIDNYSKFICIEDVRKNSKVDYNIKKLLDREFNFN
jgi:hypothetical protein